MEKIIVISMIIIQCFILKKLYYNDLVKIIKHYIRKLLLIEKSPSELFKEAKELEKQSEQLLFQACALRKRARES